MKIKELKNKIVLAELDPNCDYLLLVNPALVNMETLNSVQLRPGMRVQFVIVSDVDKAVKFVEVPKKK